MARTCRLDALAGRETICSEQSCPFWEPGGAALEGRCVFDLVDLGGRPDLVAELRHLREVLGTAAPGEEEVRARHHFHELLNESGEE